MEGVVTTFSLVKTALKARAEFIKASRILVKI